MKQTLFLCTLCCWVLFAQGQAGAPLPYTDEDGEQYVYGDSVFVRSHASLQAMVIDTLLAGHLVTIVERKKELATLKGISAPWIAVTYEKEGQQRQGCLWSGLLALKPLRRGNTKFVYGVETVLHKKEKAGNEYFTTYDFIIGLKVLVENQKVAHQQFKLDEGQSAAFTNAVISDGKGLTGLKNIVALHFTGEACGIPALTYRFGWNGEQLVALPLQTGISDAGVFYHTEELIFPADAKGKTDTIIWLMEEGEQTEQYDKKGEPIYKVKKSKKTFPWNGTSFTAG